MNDNGNKETGALVKVQGTGIQKVSSGLVRRGMEDVLGLVREDTTDLALGCRVLSGHAFGVGCLAFSTNGERLASGSGNVINIWDVLNGKLVWTLEGRSFLANSIAFSELGDIASPSIDCSVKLWDRYGNQNRTLFGHSTNVVSVAFPQDGGVIIASGSEDKTIKIWGTSDGHLRLTLIGHNNTVWSMAFSSCYEALLASGSLDKTIKIWSLLDGQLKRTLVGHTHPVISVAFSPDDRLLASGCGDKTIKIWRVADGNLLKTLIGHTHQVRSVAFSPDGSLLASGSWDKTIKLWRVSDGTHRTLEAHTDRVESVAFSPDGSLLASGSHDKTVRLWRLK